MGSLISLIIYENGIKITEEEYQYYESIYLNQKVNYKYGKPHGLMEEFNKDGSLKSSKPIKTCPSSVFLAPIAA